MDEQVNEEEGDTDAEDCDHSDCKEEETDDESSGLGGGQASENLGDSSECIGGSLGVDCPVWCDTDHKKEKNSALMLLIYCSFRV